MSAADQQPSQRPPASDPGPPGEGDSPIARRVARTPAQWIALIVGLIFLLVGVLGFIPGVTTNYDTMSFASHGSEALLLGLFQVSILHNVVHLLFGIAGLIVSGGHRSSWLYLIIGGAVYFVLFLYGLLIDPTSAANFIPVNAADNWLHLGLSLAMIIAGLATRRARTARRALR